VTGSIGWIAGTSCERCKAMPAILVWLRPIRPMKLSVVMRSLLAFIVHNDAAADKLACSGTKWRARHEAARTPRSA
jgi:hypothetical protein